MNLIIRYRICTILSVFLASGVWSIQAQTIPAVDASKAVYVRIDSVHCINNTNHDSAFVSSVAGFNVNDTILVFQPVGAEPYAPGTGLNGQINSLNNVGRYAIVKISEINAGQKLIVFNTTLPPGFTKYTTGEFGQIVRIPTYNRARIAPGFDFPEWDPVTRTGGIFVVLTRKRLELETDLRADGKGFKGGSANTDYNGSCSSSDGGYLTRHFASTAVDSSGRKGESLIRPGYPFTRGLGFMGNAGGGGNGLYSGGGGGGNKGKGGKGGNESATCGIPGNTGGEGGELLAAFFNNTPGNQYYNRIYFGGGGGTGTGNSSLGRTPTNGGNGGGILIVVTDTLVANGNTIAANGQSVAGFANGGGGGGGAGGTVVLDINTYVDIVNVEVKGGNGGWVSGSPSITGPGAGGGGGQVWHNNASFPVGKVNLSLLPGQEGRVQSDNSTSATSAGLGARQGNLTIPIRGFIINTSPDTQWVCGNETPKLMTAPKPKGGTGIFTYKWLQSSDELNWVPANGVNDQMYYQPPVLSDTMYYRRIVNDGQLPPDTSFYVPIYHYPAITGNLVAPDSTICMSQSAGVLSGTAIIGGGDRSNLPYYQYTWQSSSNGTLWSTASGSSNQPDYSTPTLTDTIYYRRLIASGKVCRDTSNMLTIRVLNDLSGNTISAPQIICNNQVPASLGGPEPAGGLPGDKRYIWQHRIGAGAWNSVAVSKDYAPPALAANPHQYRRIALSGVADVCKDTSNNVQITSLPSISNNMVTDNDSTICANLPGIILDGTQPSGGDNTYRYSWLRSASSTGPWTESGVETSLVPYLPGSLNSTTWFRRKVASGLSDVCKDTSELVKITVLPSIMNNTTGSNQTICADVVAEDLTGAIPAGGDGAYTYQWQRRTSLAGGFTDITTNGNTAGYNVPALSDTTWFRRIVRSGPFNTCQDTSALVVISVLPEITGNTIVNPPPEACLETQPSLTGSNPSSGGNGIFSYRWQVSTDNSSWSDAPLANSSKDYTTESFLTPKYFRRLVNSVVCRDTSGSVFIDTLHLPRLDLLSANRDSVCHLETGFRLITGITAGQAPYQVRYVNGVDASEFTASGLAPTEEIPVSGFPQQRLTYQYRLVSVTDSKGCNARSDNLNTFSRKVELFPDAQPVIQLQDSVPVCDTELMISADPDIAVVYGWSITNPDIVLDNPGALNTIARVVPGFNMKQGYLKFSASSPGCMGISGYKPSVDSVKLAFFEQPDPVKLADTAVVIFIIDSYWVKHDPPTAGQIDWSLLKGGGTFGTRTTDSILIEGIPVNETSIYRASLSNGSCELTSADVSIERREVHIFEGISPNSDDGMNDLLVAEGLDIQGIEFSFQIFSTSGLLVREINSEDIDIEGFRRGLPNNGLVIWDGKDKTKNNLVPGGHYYYVLIVTYKGRDFIAKGFIVVK